MKADELLDLLGKVDDSLIADARSADESPATARGTTDRKESGNIPRKKTKWIAYAACICAVAFVCGAVLFVQNRKNSKETITTENSAADIALSKAALVSALYPETATFPNLQDYILPDSSVSNKYFVELENWSNDNYKRRSLVVGNTDGFKAFNKNTIKSFLEGTTENRCYSPINLYIALAMLTEATNGQTQSEILNFLGYDSVEELRSLCKSLWEITYMNDGYNFSIPAASIWLNDSAAYNKDTLQKIADNYYASSYSGEMGSDYYNLLLRDWINFNTGGLLKEQTSELSFDAATVLAIASTNYFRAKWAQYYNADRNVTDVFHSPDRDINCEYMTRSETGKYYYGEKFGAIELSFDNHLGNMWFILPEEGITCDELLKDEEALDFIVTGDIFWSKNKLIKINQMIPKFDITSRLMLNEKLSELGISSVFTPGKDFEPLYDGQNIPTFLSKIEHSVRVAIDEEGVTAASYTVELACGAAEPPEEYVNFFLDRPFIFVIKNDYGLPLFTGIVSLPE